jgi:sigma-B regulation protein RsbU (phosphoserine phosphatase)
MKNETSPDRTGNSPIRQHRITVLLIDDQPMIGEAVRRMLAGEGDISFHYCSDPQKALDQAIEISPTVILQDLVMPNVDGLTLVRRFRETPDTRVIPLIVLSSKEEPIVKAEAFALGANDYLVKLPDKIELIARIRYHSRGYINLLERNEAYDALLESQQRLAAELTEAADYVTSLLPSSISEGSIRTTWKFLPSTQLGGDSFGYHWLDSNHFAMYLLDVCGHGVGAALLSVSVMNVLRSQSLPNTDFRDPAAVLSGLNAAFPMEQHNRMYFTIWYGVYETQSRKLRYSSGGHPPAVLRTGPSFDASEVHLLSTPCLVIGAIPEAKFVSGEIQLHQFADLFLFSDGVYEITLEDGTMLDRDEFIRVLTSKDQTMPVLDRILDYTRKLQKSDTFEDDFSILQVIF